MVPGRTSIYRALVRNGLVSPGQRRKRRSDYRRWERARPMELWQMDVVGGFHLVDGTELKAVSGIDDSSRFVVSAMLVARATAKPVCDALLAALRRHGVPEQILTDNGKVFTGRFGPAGSSAEVLFDRICAENGIRHLLTAPRSPTTTGKVERWHKTMRAEFLTEHDRRHHTMTELQAALDGWVAHYNTERPHQSLGMRPPVDRFQLGGCRRRRGRRSPVLAPAGPSRSGGGAGNADHPAARGAAVGRPARPDLVGRLPLPGPDRARRGAGRGGGRRTPGADLPPRRAGRRARATPQTRQRQGGVRLRQGSRRARRPTDGMAVTRVIDSSGYLSFAGTNYRVGNAWRGRSAQVAIVADSVQISCDGQIVRLHPIRHDRTKEHGAFATPNGRPRHRQDAPAGAGVKATPLRSKPAGRALTPTP